MRIRVHLLQYHNQKEQVRTDEEMEEIQSRVGDYDMFVGGLSIASDDVTHLLEYVEELRNLLNEKE